MSFNPTPGPWTCDENGLVNGMDSRKRFAGSPSHDIFNAREWPTELQCEADDNAHLIAAAPKLLAACEALVVVVRQSVPKSWAGVIEALVQGEEAIAEARGGGS